MTDPAGEVILYRSDGGESVVHLRVVGGTVWLTQAQMADLYGTSKQNVQQVVARVLADGEVDGSTVNSELTVRAEGTRQVRRELKVYNLDMVLAVGYRVTTPRAVQFRQWATTVLKEYLVKGFALQDERLTSVEDDQFRSAISECLAAWYFRGMLGLPTSARPTGNRNRPLELLVKIPEGDMHVEVSNNFLFGGYGFASAGLSVTTGTPPSTPAKAHSQHVRV